jgi:hypothetical protein
MGFVRADPTPSMDGLEYWQPCITDGRCIIYFLLRRHFRLCSQPDYYYDWL